MSGRADIESMATPTFITLGPVGTDHERATRAFIEFQGLSRHAKLDLVDNMVETGVERVHDEPNSFLVQCSAHPDVHLATERYPQEVVVGTTFIYPTRDLSLLVRKDVEDPQTIALVPATRGYIKDLTPWAKIIDEQSKPVISEKLVEGEYDAGITFTQLAWDNPDDFDIVENYGEVDTTWIVYGRGRRGGGTIIDGARLIAERIPWFFTGQEEPAAPVS